MESRYQTIIFDFDGTIADTEPFYAKNFLDVMEEYGVSCDEEDCAAFIGYGPKEKTGMVNQKYHKNIDHEEVTVKFRKLNVDRFPEDASGFLFDDVIEILDLCKEKGMTIMVCSNTDSPKVLRILKQMKIDTYFDAVIGKDISLARKPSSQPYEYIISHYGLNKDEVIVIEDSMGGIQSAKGAGLKVIGLIRDPRAKLEGMDHLIYSLHELKDYI